MELDVPTIQLPRGPVSIRELEGEDIVAARFPIVRYVRLVGETGLSIDLRGPLDVPSGGAGLGVGRYAGSLHLHPGAVVDIGQVTPEGPSFEPPGHREVALRGRGRAGYTASP